MMMWFKSAWMLRGLRIELLACCSLILLLIPVPLLARDVFVVINGGISPTGNNYSQFLSARGFVTYLRGRYAPEDIWVFFGAGNVTGSPPVLNDVMQMVPGGEGSGKGDTRVTWIPGALPGNRPARRDVIERAFREEILPAVRDGGTLYLMVGDHGSPMGMVGDPNSESLINLWGLKPDPTHRYGWRQYDESLGVGELRGWLVEGLGRGRVVFVMTQCFSGGFHQLGVSREVAPRSEWFVRPPLWAARLNEVPPLPVAGFTATDNLTVASGCTPDVEADNWAGYERYLVEELSGLDLFDLTPSGRVRDSFHEAHVAAALVDQTIDKPRSTSEEYLAGWARLFARMAAEPEDNISESLRPALAEFRKVMDGGPIRGRDRALLSHKAQIQRLNESMLKSNPALKDLLSASGAELETAMKERRDEEPEQDEDGAEPENPPEQDKDGAESENQHGSDADSEEFESPDVENGPWEQVKSAWKDAIESGTGPALSEPVMNYERIVLRLDDPVPAGKELFMMEYDEMDVYWAAGYAHPQTFKEAHAREIEAWIDSRRNRIIDWAKASGDPQLRHSAEEAGESPPDMFESETSEESEESEWKEPPRPSRKVAATRIHFFRQVLAAWQFLLEVNDRAALTRLKEVIELERAALPAPIRRNSSLPHTTTARQSIAGARGIEADSNADADRVKSYPLDICIVAGVPLDTMGDERSLVYKRQEFKFCCAPCVTKFRADPEKYLQMLRTLSRENGGGTLRARSIRLDALRQGARLVP